MASTDIWSDFDTLRHNIKLNTVDRLKQILTGLNEQCATVFFKSGKKQDIIDRIVAQLDSWRHSNNTDKWVKAKAVLYQVRTSGGYSPSTLASSSATLSTPTVPQNPYAPLPSKVVNYHSTAGIPPTVSRYDPYAPPRRPAVAATPSASTSATPKQGIRFRPSPFFRVDQMVSSVIECPESSSPNDRRQQTVTFTLSHDQISKVKFSSKYQLRLFCTSSIFYSPAPGPFRNTAPCPIEFPPTCEVRVNNIQLSANLKGLKKKPGTAPPADLGKAVRISSVQNRVEMVYVNSQQPIQHKKFYLVVMLVEITTVDQLVDRLAKGKFRSGTEIRRKMIESMSEDDDIVAGPQKMSLKCPLSFMRVTTPCRSMLCVHSQCFDATSWFSMMEQTTTWLCPVCEKVLNYDDLIIDGYFDDILKQCPESVEDVVVEADGEWHTADGKYGSENWKSSNPVSTTTETPSPRKPSVTKTPPQTSKPTTDQNGDTKANDPEIVVLDSDDEDEGRVKRELSPSFGRGSSLSANRSLGGTSAPRSQSQVIDLTLDSDDDEPPVPRRTEKRKATEEMSPTEQIWKKGRQDTEPASGVSAPPNGHAAGATSPNGWEYPPYPFPAHLTQTSPRIPPVVPTPAAQYTNNYAGNPTVFSHYNVAPSRGGTSMTNTPTLPPINRAPYMPRINSRWPGA